MYFFLDNVDYLPPENRIVSISAITNSSQCVEVNIVDDNVLEGLEEFAVFLEVNLTDASSNVAEGVTVTQNGLIVKIADDEGNDDCYMLLYTMLLW